MSLSLHEELESLDPQAVFRLDLMAFLELCFLELNPGVEFSDAAHLHVMTARLAACLLGCGSKRLIINLPPRSLKSITVSVAAVAWLLGQDPTKQIICASYGQALADKHALDTRNLMMGSAYREIFPSTRLSQQKYSVNDFATTKNGSRMATSVGGVLTGRGADIIILDDPIKPEDAQSETRRGNVNEWYDNTLLSRLNNKQDGIIIIVMQRLHEDDLVGHLLDRGEEWEVLSFPAIAIADECHEVETVTGPFSFARKKGEVLDPSRESLGTLQAIRGQIGSSIFNAQYQQEPTAPEGGLIKPEWIKYYDPAQLPRELWPIVQSWDTATKSGELNDYSVCTTWGITDSGLYLLDVFRARLNFPDLRKAVLNNYRKFDVFKVLIEDHSSGTSLIQDLQADGLFYIEAHRPAYGSDKHIRLAQQSPKFERGRVHLPRAATWLGDYLHEITGFPGTKHDDQVDSTSQALEFLTTYDHGCSVGGFRRSTWGYETS